MYKLITNHCIKKISVLGLVFCVVFNSIGFVLADDPVIESNERIADYCEEHLGEDWKNFSFYYPEKSEYTKRYTKLKEEYHDDINALFAEPIQEMLKAVGEESSLDKVCTDSKITEKVSNAFTTYEISQKALCRYARYQTTLQAKMDYISTDNLYDPDIKELMADDESVLQVEIFQALQVFGEQIEVELEVSKMAIDKTLAAYDELVIMYPLHLRFRCIISDLLTFREHLANLVNVFFCLERYIGAASDKID